MCQSPLKYQHQIFKSMFIFVPLRNTFGQHSNLQSMVRAGRQRSQDGVKFCLSSGEFGKKLCGCLYISIQQDTYQDRLNDPCGSLQLRILCGSVMSSAQVNSALQWRPGPRFIQRPFPTQGTVHRANYILNIQHHFASVRGDGISGKSFKLLALNLLLPIISQQESQEEPRQASKHNPWQW